MKLFQRLLLLFFVCRVLNPVQAESPVSKNNLQFPNLASSWDEAIPLGNGMLGALVWQKGDNLRFSLDRADLWDLRPMENMSRPEFSFQWVQQQVENNSYKKVQDLFDVPYDQSPAPSKIPGAALEFAARELGEVLNVKLCLENALCETTWKNGITLQTFVHAENQAGWFKFAGVRGDFVPVLVPPQYRKEGVSTAENSVTGQDLQRLGYDQGKIDRESNKIIYRQKGWNGFEYEVAVTWKHSGNTLAGVWSISSVISEKKGASAAGEFVSSQLQKESFEKALQSHVAWWASFWKKSEISLPDSILEKQWYLEQYKFGSAARADAPPISLQAVWTADNGKLPPWKGDFHHDLNTQLSYWPSYSGNHLDLEAGYLNWLWENRETFRRYTRTYFATSGMNVPGVTSLTGEPMGGWIQYSLGPTVGCWLAQHFYLHWLYSKDRQFLREKAYPWLSDVAVFLDQVSIKDSKGMRRLPLSSSPEIHDNSINAWFRQTTNFDLAFIRWTYEKAAELAEELGNREEAVKWRSLLHEWPNLALDDKGGLAFAPGSPYSESHRHFSHLMGWHPLGILDWSNGEKDQDIIRATLLNLENTGPDWWCGYSYSWMGNLYARAFMGEKAAETLRIFSDNFCLPNSFHVNGEQHNKGYSNFKYRPFTLEGNFAFAAGIQEMLLQSHTGTIRIFPAIPPGWKDVSFKSLRTEGAFLISAEKSNGRLERITIHAETGGSCKLANPFGTAGYQVKYSWPGKAKTEGEMIIIDFPENGSVEMSATH
jgi:alpha-L-fucosidase 2